ncbi:hypothetical protein EDB85DRAFT_2288048 [Lactarius pseudohatsudake]|nr:hypothetical protein EDB85DRAFT_2288048 [Lactarius pseudohatsudake]
MSPFKPNLHRCRGVAVFSFQVSFTLTTIFSEEALTDNRPADDNRGSPPERTGSRLGEDAEQPQPLLTRPVLTSVANHTSLALLDTAGALMSLVWSTPIVAQRTRPDSGTHWSVAIGVRLRERPLPVRVLSTPRRARVLARGAAIYVLARDGRRVATHRTAALVAFGL